MNRPDKHTTKSFTLVEIMIAMAVLVIMMGFLFQFINSAQKLWSASTRTASLFDQAQLVLQLIEQDLQSALVVDEKDCPGGSIPMILYQDSDDHLINLFLFTPTEGTSHNNVGVYPILYDLDNGILHRYLVDSDFELTFGGNLHTFTPHFIFGLTPLSIEEKDEDDVELAAISLINDIFPKIKGTTAMKHFLAEGIDSLNIKYMTKEKRDSEEKKIGGESYWFFRNTPKFVRITLSMYDTGYVKPFQDAGADSTVIKEKKDETMRNFSKIVFLR